MHSNKFKTIHGFMAQNHLNSSSSQDSDDEEEHFVDAKDDEDAAEEMESKDDDAASDEGCSGNIADDDVKAGHSSWVHRKNLSCNNLIINCFDCEMINQAVNCLNEMPDSPMQL